jgi:hypothetical protein
MRARAPAGRLEVVGGTGEGLCSARVVRAASRGAGPEVRTSNVPIWSLPDLSTGRKNQILMCT